jgi:ribonuclease BN (tRNA processing enzyme)
LASKSEFHELGGGPLKLGKVAVHPFPVNHPQGAWGFRIESDGASIVYAPDREFGDSVLDATMREFSDRASILIVDSQFTREEYPQHKGWGHSTWNDAVEVARDSKVEQLILFHHDPDHDDEAVIRIEAEAKKLLPGVCAAREGWVAEL